MDIQLEEQGLPGTRTGCLGRMVQIGLFLTVTTVPFVGQLWAWVGGAATSSEVDAALVTAVQAALTALPPG